MKDVLRGLSYVLGEPTTFSQYVAQQIGVGLLKGRPFRREVMELVPRWLSRMMACVAGDARLDPKAVRAFLGEGWRRLRFATAEEILEITGCVQGAVAPLGLPDDVSVVFDEAIARCGKVSVSSGDPMAGLELDPNELIRVAGARLAEIAEEERCRP